MASNSRIDIPNQTNVTWLIDALLKSGAYNTIRRSKGGHSSTNKKQQKAKKIPDNVHIKAAIEKGNNPRGAVINPKGKG
jgi:hypothetical protein